MNPVLTHNPEKFPGLTFIGFCDSNELNLTNEISYEEVETLFGIEVTLTPKAWVYLVPKKPFSTIVDINTMCGFDPSLEGADICEYFDLPRMKVFQDPVEYFPRK